MNKTRYAKIIFCGVVLTAVIWADPAQSQSAQSEYEQKAAAEVGRENPFAKIPDKEKLISQKLLESSQSDEKTPEKSPELFVETVTLKSINAGSLEPVLEDMLSKYGRISTDQKSNSLIICDTKEYLEKILEQIKKADSATIPQQGITEEKQKDEKAKPELFVETITLKFLNAKELKTTIGNMSSEYGSVSIDEKSNSLIICDTKENLEKILEQIKKADKTPRQIMVEVVILDVQLKDDTEIGINWDILSNKNYDVGYRQNFTTTGLRVGSTIASSDNIGNATAFNSTGLAGDFSIISGTIRNVIHLIQQKRNVEILASPRVMMVSGQSAYIKAVEEIPYKEMTETSGGGGGVSALTSTQFKEVGVNLQVTATITDDDGIFLTVETEQNVKTSVTSAGVPVVDTRKAKTSLLLKDSQIVVIGGLRRQEKTKKVDQIPILGDLPIIGELFKSTNTVINNSELIVFLSPHIYKNEAIPDKAMAKYNEIKNRPILSIPDEEEKKLLGLFGK